MFHRLRSLGFGNMLEEGEGVHKVYRTMFTFVLKNIVVQGLLWWGGAYVVYFFYPWHGRYLWLALLVVGAVMMLGYFWKWFFNALLVTNLNLIIVRWDKIFHKRITRLDYWNLEEISVDKAGWRAFMYNYGTLAFQRMSGGVPVSFDLVPHPTKVAKTIEFFKEKLVHQKNFTEESAFKDLIGAIVTRQVENHGVGELPQLRIPSGRRRQRGSRKPRRIHWSEYVPWVDRTEGDGVPADGVPDKLVSMESAVTDEPSPEELEYVLVETEEGEEFAEVYSSETRRGHPHHLPMVYEKRLDDAGGLEFGIEEV